MHLQMAEAIKTAVSHQDDPACQQLALQLTTHWSPFYFGQIAPDFSFISDLRRSETHFYDIPLTRADDPIGKMLTAHPELNGRQLSPSAQKLFIAGYLTHLLYDQLWFLHIITPHFWNNEGLGEPQYRHLIHLLLQAAHDNRAFRELPANAGQTLQQAQPRQWLPFGSDDALLAWRDLVANQFVPHANVRTYEIFARRVRLDEEAFAAYIEDEVWMSQHVHAVVDQSLFDTIFAKTRDASLLFLKDYLLTDTAV